MKKGKDVAYLSGQDNESNANHDDHIELRRPYIWDVVAITHSWEGHYNKVARLEQVEVPMTCSLEMLNSAHTDAFSHHENIYEILCYFYVNYFNQLH